MLSGSLFARLPRNRRVADSPLGRRVRAGLARAFPHWTARQHARAYDRLLSSDFVNRVIFRFHNAFPSAASVLARFVPVSRSRELDELISGDGPIVLALNHLGPVWFLGLVLRLLLRGRTVYGFHAERGADGPRCVAFLRRIGIVPVLDDRMAARTLLHALRNDVRPVVIVGFDHLAVGSRRVPFLASEIAVSDGIAFIADQADAPLVTVMSDFRRGYVRLVLDGPFRTDKSLPAGVRRERVVDAMYRVLERYVEAAPDQWSEWQFLALDVT